MPFDPTKPVEGTLVDAVEIRNQLNALKALIDAQTALLNSLVPVGMAFPWFNHIPGVPALPANFVECNGQTLNDPGSPLHGQVIPDINVTQRFLRGGAASGDTGGAATHTHLVAMGGTSGGVNIDSGGSGIALDADPKATSEESSLPPYMDAVFVMRVK